MLATASQDFRSFIEELLREEFGHEATITFNEAEAILFVEAAQELVAVKANVYLSNTIPLSWTMSAARHILEMSEEISKRTGVKAKMRFYAITHFSDMQKALFKTNAIEAFDCTDLFVACATNFDRGDRLIGIASDAGVTI